MSYECTICFTETALTGSCCGCGAPSVVEDIPRRRVKKEVSPRVKVAVMRLATLIHNFQIAASLCRAFELGSEYRMRAMIGLPADEDWTPGCGRPHDAPGDEHEPAGGGE